MPTWGVLLACALAFQGINWGGGLMQNGPVGLVLPIAGNPMSAEQVEERHGVDSEDKDHKQVLITKVLRDASGRFRLEWRIEHPSGESATVVYLIDPVSKSAYMLLAEAKIALRISGEPSGPLAVGFPSDGRPLPDSN